MSKELKTRNYCGGDGYYTDDDNKPCNPNKSPEVSVEDIADIIRELTDYPEEPNAKNMNEDLVCDYKERLDKIHVIITRKLTGSEK